MKQKLTIRLDEDVYQKLYFYAKERKISVNKLVASMIDRCIDVPRDVDFFGNVIKYLKSLELFGNYTIKQFRCCKNHILQQQLMQNI